MHPLGRVRPGMAAPPAEAQRPHAAYKAELRARLRQLAPRSVLDIGCGDGALLETLRTAGCDRCVGLEVSADLCAALQGRGLEALQGVGESLPLADHSIDVVVMEYTAHHLADLQAALREAARVARHAVVVLDCWYDHSVPSQVVANTYDAWCKSIDRRLGLIHNACPTVGQLAAPFQALGGYGVDATHRLLLRPLPFEKVSADAAAQVDRLTCDRSEFTVELSRILKRARRDGVTDDGAVLFTASIS